MNSTEDFAKRICKDTKYRSILNYLSDCRKKLPLTVYIGKKLMLTQDQIRELTGGEVNVVYANSLKDEDYHYIAVRHKVCVSKNDFIHFNPFKSIWIIGGGWNTQEYDPRYIYEFNTSPVKILMGATEVSYRTIPVEIKMQFGCFFSDYDEEGKWMESIISELHEEIEENDKNFYEVGIE